MAIIYGLIGFAALICIAVIAVSLLILRRPDDAEIAARFREYLECDA